MARNTTPKCRLCRREGIKLFLKGTRCFTKCPIDKKGAVPPGFHGTKARRKVSDYGLQLREKQKAKRIYGVLERQFRKYFDQAKKVKGATGEGLLKILETRFDNVVFRLGFTPNRTMARQLISHGHVLLNNKKHNIPSTLINIDDIVSLDSKALNNDLIKKKLEEKDRSIPGWIERKAVVGKVVKLPSREDIDIDINEQLIVEYYSR